MEPEPSYIILFLIIFSSPFALSYVNNLHAGGFSAKVFHKTSPASPFHNPMAGKQELIKQRVHNSESRAVYLSAPTYASRKTYARAAVQGDYVMSYAIGTPPMETYGVIDTASDLIWLQCTPCDECYEQTMPLFDPNNSISYKCVPCNASACFLVNPQNEKMGTLCGYSSSCKYEIMYMDNATSYGDLALETITLDDNGVTGRTALEDMIFGCGHNNTDKPGEPPGVVGLGNASHSLIGQLGFPPFSYLITEDTSGTISGEIKFGILADLSSSCYTPLVPNDRGFYHLSMQGISVAGVNLDIPEDIFKMDNDSDSGFIIDSGTTYSMLNPVAYFALRLKLIESMPKAKPMDNTVWDLCFELGDEGMDFTLPEIVFQFAGRESGGNTSDLLLCDSNAWMKVDDVDYTHDGICLTIRRSPTRLSILGMQQQRNFRFAYDLTSTPEPYLTFAAGPPCPFVTDMV